MKFRFFFNFSETISDTYPQLAYNFTKPNASFYLNKNQVIHEWKLQNVYFIIKILFQ